VTTFFAILLFSVVALVACLGLTTIAAVLVSAPQAMRDDGTRRF
jgi:hypothetical protein